MSDPPTNIRALQSEQVLELTWSPGQSARLGYIDLRAQCPCASCQDEFTGERLIDPASIPADLTLAGMEPVGNYAVRIVWSDGHGSGLFTWDLLRRLSAGSMTWRGIDPPPKT